MDDRKMNYKWVIIGVCFLMLLINSGIVLSFGIFLKPLTTQFGWSVTYVSLVMASFMLLQGVFSPYIGTLIDHHGPRKVIISGIIGFGAVLALLSQMTSFWHFIILYGVFAAIAYTTTTLLTNSVLVSGWFTENRGLALGITMSGFPLGPMVLTPYLTYFLLRFDWRVAIIAAAALVVLLLFPLVLALLRDGPGHIAAQEAYRHQEQRGEKQTSDELTFLNLLKDNRYQRLAGAYFTCGFSMAIIMAHFHNYGHSIGFELTTTARAFSLMGLLAFFGTIFSGKLSDIVERKNVLALIYFLRGISFIVMALSTNITTFFVGAIIFGIFWTATGPLTSAMCGESWGIKRMGKAFGAVFLSHQIGASVGPILAGMFFDLWGSYQAIFFFTAAILITGSIAVLYFNKAQKPAEEQETSILVPEH